ncbi:MAG TPA: V-type ATP synthase subunit E family protein [Anaerolineales bacterium]|jgi:vacuolar-type H+-ATPase subunit E/Vma4|nr:V-type ATP synthase subunit E family protein [Anaerolineales bacterium]
MRSVDENIEALSRAVLSEARSQAEQILAEARERADAIRQRARQQADAEREEILEHAAQEAERVRGQAVAAAQLKARTLHLEQREELLEGVFKAAREQLLSVPGWKDYDQIAVNLLREALQHLGASSAQVRADETIRKFLTDQVLADISEDLNVQLQAGPVLDQGIGVMVQTMDGHLQYDNTLGTRLSRMQNSLRARVYQILTGESP